MGNYIRYIRILEVTVKTERDISHILHSYRKLVERNKALETEHKEKLYIAIGVIKHAVRDLVDIKEAQHIWVKLYDAMERLK